MKEEPQKKNADITFEDKLEWLEILLRCFGSENL
jgi:hypothetical protein